MQAYILKSIGHSLFKTCHSIAQRSREVSYLTTEHIFIAKNKYA